MTPIVADRLTELETLTLKEGAHSDSASGFCAMEAAAYVAGEDWTDHPQCVCPVIGAFMRSWNDGLPSDADRDRLLKPLIPQILDTRSTREVEVQRSYLALDWLARVQAPAFLSLRDDLKAHAVALQHLAPLTDPASCAAAQPTLDAAWAAAGTAARAAAGAAARAAAVSTSTGWFSTCTRQKKRVSRAWTA